MHEGAYAAKEATGKAYDPMKKQGAIILGIGGDNSNSGVGTFFEGCITAGYASDTTDNAIQASIIAAVPWVRSPLSGALVSQGRSTRMPDPRKALSLQAGDSTDPFGAG